MRIGLIADTHIPYRAAEIPAPVLDALLGVDLILHAGDVDEPWALEVLRQLAPVYAVRGNYHFFDRSAGGASLPETVELDIAGFHIGLIHGHKMGLTTWFWKVYMLLQNMMGRWTLPAYDRALARALVRRFPCADIIVFGHTHRFYQAYWGKTLLINPGAALPTAYFNAPNIPSLAHLILESGKPPEVIEIRIQIP
ncbi:MAG TPA: metallophosphoesterase family protein [Anaerolineae bacterium]|nr:metallophosphoesterase family protein [Anaerolineae bacterium]HQI85932.1 metallophosphoesterase family protein [Anaerolineae bacterium]